MTAPALEVTGLRVRYGDTEVLMGIDLQVAPGEVVAVLGPSGSGKTTLLFAVAGFISIADGTIAVNGVAVADPARALPPERRDVAVVFQSYALWPHLSALDTVAFPLRAAGMSTAESAAEAARLLDAVGMGSLADRRPSQLSGGQQQRVGLARALARQAGIYLFDEPTAHLDATTRGAVQAEIAQRRADSGAAAVYASHDAAEALGIADRVALLRDGHLVQVGTPADVYERPTDRWAAAITGPVSILTIDLADEGDSYTAAVGGARVTLEDAGYSAAGATAAAIRPDWARLGGPLPGVVTAVWFRGPHSDVALDTPAGPIVLQVPGRSDVSIGRRVGWSLQRVWPLRD
jgi:ABC-type Fe3+/spermidine/putrescine transport system ATPase subunit